MKRKLLIGGVIVIIIAAIASQFLKRQPVEVAEVTTDRLVQSVEETGYTKTVDEVEIQSWINGKIVDVPVEIGQKVTSGQVILRMENTDLEAEIENTRVQLEGAQAEKAAGIITLDTSRMELEQAKKDLERITKLFEAGVVTSKEHEDTVLGVESLQKNISQQEAYLNSINARIDSLEKIMHNLQAKSGNLLIKSPIDGNILVLPLKKGQIAFSGSTIAKVGNPNHLEVKTDILSDNLADIKIGQEVDITAPVLGDQVLTGTVKKIYPQAEEKTSALGVIQRRVPVLIELKEISNLKPGYEVRAIIKTKVKENVVMLPREAVRKISDNTSEQVMLVVNGKIEHRQVITGMKNQDYIEIVDGLKPGDQVVRDATTNLADGTKVTIVK